LPDSWFPLEDDRTYYLTAEQALEYGLIDQIKPFNRDKPDKVQQENPPLATNSEPKNSPWE
jgi:hypothetical protein